jgi:hypothetical protein
MSIAIPTWISAIATLGLLIGACLTVYFAARAFRSQSRQLNDQMSVNQKQTVVLELQARELEASLAARLEASMLLEREHASMVVAWLGEPQATQLGWLVNGHVLNTGERPVRDISAQWYANGAPIRSRINLSNCLLSHEGAAFDCEVARDVARDEGLKVVILFRTMADVWWTVGTDGQIDKVTDLRAELDDNVRGSDRQP